MREITGISGGNTNHRLKAYGATILFQAQVPETLIQQRTGNRSLKALRQYEQISATQHFDVSNVMSGNIDGIEACILTCMSQWLVVGLQLVAGML